MTTTDSTIHRDRRGGPFEAGYVVLVSLVTVPMGLGVIVLWAAVVPVSMAALGVVAGPVSALSFARVVGWDVRRWLFARPSSRFYGR